MPKLFDSLAKLRFEGEEMSPEASDTSLSDSDAKIAIGMRSKDSEYVTMSGPCDCSGQVHFVKLSGMGIWQYTCTTYCCVKIKSNKIC